MSVVRKFERIGDLVTSMAEEVVFSATGNDIRHQPTNVKIEGLKGAGPKGGEKTQDSNINALSPKPGSELQEQSLSGGRGASSEASVELRNNESKDNNMNQKFKVGEDNGSIIEP